jgi:hypothetical protein
MMERSENKESEGRRWPAEQMETPQPRPAPFERAVDSPRRRHIPAAHGGEDQSFALDDG